jgi:hypothetical protein
MEVKRAGAPQATGLSGETPAASIFDFSAATEAARSRPFRDTSDR